MLAFPSVLSHLMSSFARLHTETWFKSKENLESQKQVTSCLTSMTQSTEGRHVFLSQWSISNLVWPQCTHTNTNAHLHLHQHTAGLLCFPAHFGLSGWVCRCISLRWQYDKRTLRCHRYVQTLATQWKLLFATLWTEPTLQILKFTCVLWLKNCFPMARASKERTEETPVSWRDSCQNRSCSTKFIETSCYGTNLQRMNDVCLWVLSYKKSCFQAVIACDDQFAYLESLKSNNNAVLRF